MRYVKAEPSAIEIKQVDWNEVFQKYQPEVCKLKVVQTNTATQKQANDWLECVCKTHPESVVAMCVKQAQGLGAREIRALVAHDNQEYYPALSANEIYQSKQLKAFPINFSIAQNEEPFIVSAVRQFMTEKYKIQRIPSNENSMLTGKEGLWLKSKPSFYGSINNEEVILDIHINRGKDLTNSDELRLHYHDLVATSVDLKPQSLFQVNLQIEQSLKEKLVEMASISPVAENAAIEILKEAMSANSDTVELSTRVIQKNQDTYELLASVGQNHWRGIVAGDEIAVSLENTKMPDELNEEYTDHSKRIMVARFMKDKASQIEEQSRQAMSDFAALNGISNNVTLPYEATTLRQSTKYDLSALFEVLTTRHDIPAERLRKSSVDLDTHLHLLDTARQNNTTISVNQMASVTKYEGFNEAAIKTAAADVGINISDYSSTSMKVYFSGQKRGDVFDALQDIKKDIGEITQGHVDTLKDSEILDDQRLKENLKDTGISHPQNF